MAKFENSKCAVTFTTAAQGIIGKDELKSIFDQIEANKHSDRIDAVAKKAAGEFLDQRQFQALQQKRTELLNVQKIATISGRIEHLIRGGLSPAKAFEADPLGMSGHPGIGERNNAESLRQTMQHVETGRIMGKLERENLKRYATSGAFDEAIMEQRWKHNTTDKAARDGMQTPNFDRLKPDQQKAVARAAELLNDHIESMRQVANTRGALIPKKESYGGAQYNDTQRIRNAANPGAINLLDRTSTESRHAYTRDLGRMIDLSATRSNLVRLGRLGPLEDLDPKKFLDSLWDIFALGIRKEPREGGMAKGGNLAASSESSRIIQFKGPAEQAEYAKKYGKGGMWESHLTQVREMAHTATSLDFYGPSGKANFERVLKNKQVELREQSDRLAADPATASQANSIYKQIDALNSTQALNYFNVFQGDIHEPGNMTIAKIENNLKALSQMRHLGSAFIANIPTMWTAPLQANYAGVGLLKASFRGLFAVLERVGKSDVKQWGRNTGVGNLGLHGQFASSVMDGAADKPGTILNNLRSKFFAFTGMTGLKDMMGANYVFMTSNEMAHNADKAFDQLPGNMQRHLSDYRLGPREWDLIRQHGVTEADGYQLLASDKFRDVPLEAFAGRTGTAQANDRLDLEMKLANLFRDSSDYATVEPDLKTQQLIPFINGPRGTVLGALGRLTMQFSTWGFAHGTKVIQRQFAARSFPEFLAVSCGGLLVSGMVSVIARQALYGRSVLSDHDLYSNNLTKSSEAWSKFLVSGMAASGIGGQLEDILFSQTYANGRGSPLQTLGGPTGNDVTQAFQWSYDGLFKHKVDSEQMLRFAQGNTPFVNAWFLKGLMNYLVWYGLQEHLNPGSLHRMEQTSAKAGAPYVFPPSQYAAGK